MSNYKFSNIEELKREVISKIRLPKCLGSCKVRYDKIKGKIIIESKET